MFVYTSNYYRIDQRRRKSILFRKLLKKVKKKFKLFERHEGCVSSIWLN